MTTLGPTFLIVSTYFPPHVGGVEVLAQGQARVLADRGYNVVVATTLTDPGAARTQVCDGYLEAPRLYAEENTHTVCIDEMTGIQALERVAATLPMKPGQTECREFEYKRHGTLSRVLRRRLLTP